MKIKEGFVIRKVAGKYVVVATGEAGRDFKGMVRLNETGKMIWEGIADGRSEEDIVDTLAQKYKAQSADDRAVIAKDVQAMIRKMADAGFLIE